MSATLQYTQLACLDADKTRGDRQADDAAAYREVEPDQ